jgi:plasmid maintenance system killer protein
LALLGQDLRHPPLQAKKYDEARDIWQGRVNASWRFYFKIDGDLCYLLDVIPHPK